MVEKKESAFEKAQRLLNELHVAKAAVEVEIQKLKTETDKLLERKGMLPVVTL